jgi:NADP-reducing hydrogenase subunit HndD
VLLGKISSAAFSSADITSELLTVTIDGVETQVPKGTLIIDSCHKIGNKLPSMCYHSDNKGLSNSGGICRICLVKVEGKPGATIACQTEVKDGMVINTMDHEIRQWRTANTAMLFSSHPTSCLSCPANTHCETQDLAASMGLSGNELKRLLDIEKRIFKPQDHDKSTVIKRNKELCIGCDRCICQFQELPVFGFYNDHEVGHRIDTFPRGGMMERTECVQCGQCVNKCPTGALTERTEVSQVWDAIKNPDKKVIFQTAPAVRVAIAEEFGFQPGEKMLKNEIVTALKLLGPNITVMDTNFTADLTIIEEGTELIERLTRALTGKKTAGPDKMNIDLPMFTSCCPAWITFLEKKFPDLLDNASSCKSPQQMFGSLAKAFWAKLRKVHPEDVVSVSIMPCTAKKAEKDRPEFTHDGVNRDVDHVLTTRELANMIKQAGINPSSLRQTEYDSPFGDSTGAAVIFGATGGVMEAALRTAYEIITGREVPFENLDIIPCRGMEGVKEAGVLFENVKPEFSFLEGVTLKIAIAHGLANAKELMKVVRKCKETGEPAPWHFIEVMSCPGGCIGGGGQPKPTNTETRKKRTNLIYEEDRNLPRRKSHDNPDIQRLYESYLHEPLGHRSHHLLHTTYSDKTIKYENFINMFEAAGIESTLSNFPKGKKDELLNILIAESDRAGYISEGSIVKIAEHTGVPPIFVDITASSYHFFHRKPMAENTVYMCQCINCQMKGHNDILKIAEDVLSTKVGGTSVDGKISLETVNWLGWCANEAPGIMIKRRGEDNIHILNGANKNTIEQYLKEIGSGQFRNLMPEDKIKYSNLKRLNLNFPSFMTKTDMMDMSTETCRIGEKAERMGPDQVIDEVINAGLQGRGGAGFPSGVKWRLSKNFTAPQKYVVCNAEEGLPSNFKDWCLIKDENSRNNMLTGMGICARAIGAKTCYVYMRYEYRNLMPEMKKSIDLYKKRNPQCNDIEFILRIGGGSYIAGEETAQFESIEGKPARPRKIKNKFPTEEGLFNMPTVINNVETFCAIPYIISDGAENWAQVGIEGMRGPKILTVTGDVGQPEFLEYPLGIPFRSLLSEIGAKDVIAAEVGGTTEPIVFSEDFGKPLGFGKGYLNAVGSVVLFNKYRNINDIYTEKIKFMAIESCLQCVPCRDGSRIFYDSVNELNSGIKKPDDKGLNDAADAVEHTSICAHGNGVGKLYKSYLSYLERASRYKHQWLPSQNIGIHK